ncbi:PAS domain-containing protein [Paenibacillus sanguinis]|uniref:PAS domain-containing protein n=1 Tax=Paenibacillus sanguinis TaxID=225906 RepID=UPI000361CA1E|nr:PAS domain-containing protein [Paenibacillus sanguinis]
MNPSPSWKEAFHALNQSIAILAVDGTVAYINRTWVNRARLFGLSPFWDRPGNNLLDYLRGHNHHLQQEAVQELFKHVSLVLGGALPAYATELCLTVPQGDHWFLAEVTPYGEEGQLPQGLVVTCTDITRLKEQIHKMEHDLSHIRTLRGLLPICAVCKKIKDEQDIWSTIEAYLIRHTHAEFTHDICPDCIRALYPKYAVFLDLPSEGEQ